MRRFTIEIPIILKVLILVLALSAWAEEPMATESANPVTKVEDAMPQLPPSQVGTAPLPPEVESDEPAVFQLETAAPKAKALEVMKVEEQPTVLMEHDKPDYIPLFFDPQRNGVIYSHQEIEYDLTNPLILRIGPLAVTAAGVVMRMSRETGQFFEFDFGLDMQKRFANMYMISFQWPLELIPDGNVELFNDKGKVLWRRSFSADQANDWRKFVSEELEESTNESNGNSSDTKSQLPKKKVKVGAERLKSTGHDQSSFGLFGKEIFEIPVWNIVEPFRFCITKDAPEGRIALCSKRYRFMRKGGRYWVVSENRSVISRVKVNDKEVTLKGSAVFIDDKTPIKFAALMGNGTYFEFVSYPKKITVVDMVLNEESNQIELIGFGPPPMGPIERISRHGKDYWDFLNFMPTIGDFRQFWKATFPAQGGNLYLRGYGGAPFKQPFVFERLPRRRTRPRIHIRSPHSTYAETVKLRGETSDPVQVSSSQSSARNLKPAEFEWQFLAKTRGQMNQSEILVKDGKYTFKAFHEIYKGFPRELSARVTGVVTSDLQLVLLGEAAGQWWFERLFGWDNPTYSLQRWGVNAKFFQSLAAVGGNSEGQSLIKLQVATVDLKYRLTPGIWGRDPALGIMVDAQQVVIEDFNAQMLGLGAFWARSMPRFVDGIFNIIPFMRYPKWVDVEGIIYLLPVDSAKTRLGVNAAMNFHGKVLWSERIFGEAGFGLKMFQFDDFVQEKQVGLAIAYGTLGLGYNF